MTQTSLVLAVYDVANDRRRRKLHALLKQYGVPVQESAFEARLTRVERDRLLERAARILDEAEDRFVVYLVPKTHEPSIMVLGVPRPLLQDEGFYLI